MTIRLDHSPYFIARDGLTYDYDDYISSPAWRAKRQEVFRLQGRLCSNCTTIFGRMHVHHLHYDTLGWEDPENDLVVLCEACHEMEHGIQQSESSYEGETEEELDAVDALRAELRAEWEDPDAI